MPKELIVADDFTADARIWGYKRDNDRECNVFTPAKQANLWILKEKQTAIRIGKRRTENDTTRLDMGHTQHPSPSANCSDALGSKHLPVEIELMTERHPNTKWQISFINLAPEKVSRWANNESHIHSEVPSQTRRPRPRPSSPQLVCYQTASPTMLQEK